MSNRLLELARKFNKQKSLGQCFLCNEDILDQIVEESNLSPNDLVLEIGPGIGFLTEKLIPKAKAIYGVELDRNTLPYLEAIAQKHPKFQIFRQDILQTKIEDILDAETRLAIESGAIPKLKIVANIPYQISSRILVHFLGEIGEASPNQKYISEINILVQEEFARRIASGAACKAYGSITLLVNYWADVEYLFYVAKENFNPSPKVNSAFIKIKLLDKPRVESSNTRNLRKFIKAVFLNRRKTLTNGLIAGGYDAEIIKKLDLGNIRGETLSLEEMNSLAEKLIQ